jgi:methyl-accepting chemotaxis protein
MDNESILLAFAVVTGLALVFQTILMLAVFLAVRKGALALKEQAEEIRSAALPIIHSTEQLCLRLGPKIEATLDRVEITVEDLSDITRSLRNQTMEVQALTQEITGRVRRQSQRIDGIFSNALDVVEQAGGFVANVVSKPVRQVTGVVASVKAIVDSLRASEARPRHNHSPRS